MHTVHTPVYLSMLVYTSVDYSVCISLLGCDELLGCLATSEHFKCRVCHFGPLRSLR